MNASLKEVYETLLNDKQEETFEENDSAAGKLLANLNNCEEKRPEQLYFLVFKSIFTVNIAKQISVNSYLLSKALEVPLWKNSYKNNNKEKRAMFNMMKLSASSCRNCSLLSSTPVFCNLSKPDRRRQIGGLSIAFLVHFTRYASKRHIYNSPKILIDPLELETL